MTDYTIVSSTHGLTANICIKQIAITTKAERDEICTRKQFRTILELDGALPLDPAKPTTIYQEH